jgi:hypothetical protein
MRTHIMTATFAVTLFASLAAGALVQLPDLQDFPDVPIACFTGVTLAQNPDFKGFPDVPKNHWANKAVTDLARRGIVHGYPAEGGKLKAKPSAQTDATGNTKPTPKRVAKGNPVR